MRYVSKKEELMKLNKKVSLKNIKKQILGVLEEVGDISVNELCSYFFSKGNDVNWDMFLNTFIKPLVDNNDVLLANRRYDEVFYGGLDRTLGNVILKLGESR